MLNPLFKLNLTSQRVYLTAPLLLMGIVFVHGGQIHAQTISFRGSQMMVAAGFLEPLGTAIDSAGNVYVSDAGNHRVVRIAPGASSDCSTGCTEVGGSFTTPTGIALDPNGNLYVTDEATGHVVKVNAAGITSTIATLLQPSAIAVGPTGNVYVVLLTGTLLELNTVGLATTLLTDLNQPSGIALDQAGNIYIADTGNNQIVKVTQLGVESTLVVGLKGPSGVALDSMGALYIADTSNSRVVKVPTGSLNVDCTTDCLRLGNGFNQPTGLSVDAGGTLYLADSGSEVTKVAGDIDFGTLGIASSSPISQVLTYDLPGSDCSAGLTVSVLMKGAAGRDFVSAPYSTVCTPGTLTTLSTTVWFNPQAPGIRLGAIQLADAGGSLRAVTYLHGIGEGPQVTWTPGVATSVIGH